MIWSPRLIGYSIAGIAIAALLWRVNVWRGAYTALPAMRGEVKRLEQDLATQAAAQERAAQQALAVANELAALRNREAEIVTKIVTVPRKELVYVKVPGECPVRSDSFRVLYNEAVTGAAGEPPASGVPRGP